ncbi:uncharacterized protein LOC118185937 [Stegodyphus dumicola]|uniref:uncharacterized protein LOC118185937 n=1 Tax=Stegodyphus dumicola TaxID=202533 RepID=UPI0015AEA2CF|nr:uncharacterized protein LOC118185937 [Stegodyphus dumicola]
MKKTACFALLSLLGFVASAQFVGTVHPSLQKRGQSFLTTMPATTTANPMPSTTISLSPQTSISVHHTIVRNKPAYPYPYTDSPLQTDGAEDTSYYYTYEDVSEESSNKVTSTLSPETTTSTAKPTIKSFWNSQKALLDARRKESSQKYISTYNRETKSENKPKIEFKVREKPKFGLANKKKESLLIADVKKEESKAQTKPNSSTKVAKNNVEANLSDQKNPGKDVTTKEPMKSNSNLITNQIVGRVGELPIQNNLSPQIQSPVRAQSTIINSYGGNRPSKFDESIGNTQFVDNSQQHQALLQALNQATLRNNRNQQPLLNFNQQQPLLNLNQQQQQLLNLNQQPRNQPQQLSQQPFVNPVRQQPVNAFIATSPAINTAGRSADITGNTNSQASSLLSRLGALGLNLGGGGGSLSQGLIMGRDGGGQGNGFTLNLGPIPDPLTFLLQLLSLIPRPLLDLNGRIFFGIELGKNAGIVAGSAGKPGAYNG